MQILRTQFKEIFAKRNDFDKPVKLDKFKNNIGITSVRELQELKDGNKIIAFEFTFNTNYSLKEPKGKNLGEIKVVGDIIIIDTKEVVDNILKEWNENKKISGELVRTILNIAFEDAQIEALSHAKKVGLPLPVPLLRFEKKA
jgi:hypothetical protein